MKWSFDLNDSVVANCRACFFLISLLALSTLTSKAQQQALDSLIGKFKSYREVATTEKVYARFDQDVCLTGETLWFTVYAVNASSHEPSKMSKVAYVEVLDNVNHATLQTKIALNNGIGSGSLFMPASLVSGNYVIRVYTAWMKNFDPSYYFHKEISVINSFRRLDQEKRTAAKKTEVEFFPEGGTLINGVRTRIAYRIVNPGDSISQLSLKIINGDTTVVKPDQFGMGTFELTASSGQQPTAFLSGSDGQKQFALPASAAAGYSLAVKDSTQDLIALKIRKVNVQDDGQNVFIVIHSRNIVSLARVQRIRDGKALVVVPRSTFAEGISQITMFDGSMQPVCERLYFAPVKRQLAIAGKFTQQQYGVRRKVRMDIDVKASNGPVAAASLSVAVYRRDSLRHNTSRILNSIWLESDLQNVPALPSDFLLNITPEKYATLENIMLTHGWRHFSWSDVSKGKTPTITFIPELRGHIIRGKVIDPAGNPERNKLTYLSAPGTNIQVYGSISDSKGNVQFEMKDFSGFRRIAVQTNLSKDSTSRVTITSPFSDQFARYSFTPFSISPKLAETLAARSFSMQVQDIYYQDKGVKTRSVAIDTTAFYGKADATYYLDDYTRFPVMEEIMREYVPGVLVRKRRDGFHFINLDVVNKGTFSEDPFIMLDGLPLFDADKIMAYDPLKVKKLEVVTRRYYMGVLSLPGIVSYTTYAGDLSGFTIDPHCLVIDYEGLQMQREYYAPKYENAKQRESRLPDQRDRLFWAPSIVTDNQGKQFLEFYTSDLTGDYEVLIEGMSTKGAVGSAVNRFQVVSLNE
ncbi:hypothetical protein WBG78_21340 [Chryseolinea sp. T2]|uniref:hypothetical protein n=1 Tax=Chryseolinea sp. T2 TaxID=3129255 RepID=UPI003077D737